MLRRGNIEFALMSFSRFKTRLQQRLQQLEGFLKQEFDFSKDGNGKISPGMSPIPKIWKMPKEIETQNQIRPADSQARRNRTR